jgi:hypothetical protein
MQKLISVRDNLWYFTKKIYITVELSNYLDFKEKNITETYWNADIWYSSSYEEIIMSMVVYYVFLYPKE